MAEKRWTEAQLAAIEDEGGSLLVSAAAGSGKTAVLVERAVRRICARENAIEADRILILTFTNAAAQELRGRIAARLEEELHRHPDDVRLRKQRLLLRRAFIGTIDSLCQQLVREHFGALDIPPDVQIGDASLLEELAASALEETVEEMYESEGFRDFAALYGRARSDAAALAAVRDLYEFTRTLPHPAAYLARWAAAYEGEEELADTDWGEGLFDHAQSALAAAGRLAGEALRLAAGDEALAGYLPALSEDLSCIEALQSAVDGRRWDAALTHLHGYKPPAFKAVRGYEGYVKDQVRAKRDEVKKILAELKTGCFVCTEAQFEEERRLAAPMVGALCEAARRFGDKYLALKLRDKVVDHADLEQLALGLLQHEDGSRTAVADAVSGRYDMVMVDEYQDTNALQGALYECLAHEEGDDLFYVGDVKQSIYRFRKAQPALFLEKKAAWRPYGEGHPAVITLGHNFRSGAGVVHGVNFVFSRLMSPALGDIEYGEGERLIQGSTGGDSHGLALHLLEDPEGVGDAAFVADTIYDMVQNGYRVREGDGERACGYGDICILLRARGGMLAYVAALEEKGIPVVADMAGGLLETPEVLPLISALAAIDDPADDVDLAALMLGPLFGFTAEEVAALRTESPRGSLWGMLLKSGDEKAKGFIDTLRLWRSIAAGVSVGRLCEELLARTGYLSAVSAMEGGAARRENVLRFIGWAGEASANGRGGLSGFMRLVKGGKGPAEPPAKSLPGHVTILTIHKSKGLEFPVCILADTGRTFNRSDRAARVQLHAELGIGLCLREGGVLFHTLPSLAIRNRVSAESMSEEMRILYVALTRAKDKLIVTMAHKTPAKLVAKHTAALGENGPEPFLLARAGGFGEWLLAAALCHPDADPLWAYSGGQVPVALPAEGHWDMSVHTAGATKKRAEEAYRLTAMPDEALLAKLAERFSARPPREALRTLPRKVSVSALAKGDAPHIAKRPAFMYAAGLTAAERGTALHAFMQYADFEAAEADLGAEAGRLMAAGHLTPAEAGQVEPEAVASFFASELYSRMRKAQRVLREYDFITAIEAARLEPGLEGELAAQPVLVQGIADMVLVFEDAIEIVDYKSDRKATAAALRKRYKGQLELYAEAVAKRLEKPVTRLTIWSFWLGEEIEI